MWSARVGDISSHHYVDMHCVLCGGCFRQQMCRVIWLHDLSHVSEESSLLYILVQSLAEWTEGRENSCKEDSRVLEGQQDA